MHLSVVYQRIAFYDYFNNFPWGTHFVREPSDLQFQNFKRGLCGSILTIAL